MYHGPTGDYRLTTRIRREILVSCLYGVDVDSQAVEVTKLSLLLKLLEGESAEVINRFTKATTCRKIRPSRCTIRPTDTRQAS